MSSLNEKNEKEKEAFKAFKRFDYLLNNKHSSLTSKIETLLEVWYKYRTRDLNSSTLSQVIEILDWARLHTLNIVLTGEWKKHKDDYEGKLISEIQETQKALGQVNNALARRCHKLVEVIKNPWNDPTLDQLLKVRDLPITKKEKEFFQMETAYLVSVRLRKLCESQCEDLALNLVSAYRRYYLICLEENIKLQATDVQLWFLYDIQAILLFKYKKFDQLSNQLKMIRLTEGVDVVKRFYKKRVKVSKIWKNSIGVANLASQIYITMSVTRPIEENGEVLQQLLKLWFTGNSDDFPRLTTQIQKLIIHAESAAHIYIFASTAHKVFGNKSKALVIELYIRALTTDMNCLEKQRQDNEEDQVARVTSRLAEGFCKLADLLEDQVKVSRECMMSAFSLEPTLERLKRIEDLGRKSGFIVLNTSQWKCKYHPPITQDDDIVVKCDHCNDWTTPPKMDMPKNAKLAFQEALSVEELGLSIKLCDDLVVLLSCQRYQILSWLLEWRDLHRICIMYLNNPEATKNFVKELKFIDIDYSQFREIKPEPIDEVTGIEKGYEHCLDENYLDFNYSNVVESEGCGNRTEEMLHFFSTSSDETLSNLPVQLKYVTSQEISGCQPQFLPKPNSKSDPKTLEKLRNFRPNLKRSKAVCQSDVPAKQPRIEQGLDLSTTRNKQSQSENVRNENQLGLYESVRMENQSEYSDRMGYESHISQSENISESFVSARNSFICQDENNTSMRIESQAENEQSESQSESITISENGSESNKSIKMKAQSKQIEWANNESRPVSNKGVRSKNLSNQSRRSKSTYERVQKSQSMDSPQSREQFQPLLKLPEQTFPYLYDPGSSQPQDIPQGSLPFNDCVQNSCDFQLPDNLDLSSPLDCSPTSSHYPLVSANSSPTSSQYSPVNTPKPLLEVEVPPNISDPKNCLNATLHQLGVQVALTKQSEINCCLDNTQNYSPSTEYNSKFSKETLETVRQDISVEKVQSTSEVVPVQKQIPNQHLPSTSFATEGSHLMNTCKNHTQMVSSPVLPETLFMRSVVLKKYLIRILMDIMSRSNEILAMEETAVAMIHLDLDCLLSQDSQENIIQRHIPVTLQSMSFNTLTGRPIRPIVTFLADVILSCIRMDKMGVIYAMNPRGDVDEYLEPSKSYLIKFKNRMELYTVLDFCLEDKNFLRSLRRLFIGNIKIELICKLMRIRSNFPTDGGVGPKYNINLIIRRMKMNGIDHTTGQKGHNKFCHYFKIIFEVKSEIDNDTDRREINKPCLFKSSKTMKLVQCLNYNLKFALLYYFPFIKFKSVFENCEVAVCLKVETCATQKSNPLVAFQKNYSLKLDQADLNKTAMEVAFVKFYDVLCEKISTLPLLATAHPDMLLTTPRVHINNDNLEKMQKPKLKCKVFLHRLSPSEIRNYIPDYVDLHERNLQPKYSCLEQKQTLKKRCTDQFFERRDHAHILQKKTSKRKRKSEDIRSENNKSNKAPKRDKEYKLSPLQDLNPRMGNKDSSDLKSVLESVPGLKDSLMILPRNTDAIVQVVQVSGSRQSPATAVATSTQSSTQAVSPHIQRVGQPRCPDQGDNGNNGNSLSGSSTVSTESGNTRDALTATTTPSKTSSQQQPQPPSTLINILSQQILKPTQRRGPPVINILSQEILRPANAALQVNNGQTPSTEINNVPVSNSIKNSISGVKTVVTSPSSGQGTILQLICKSTLPKFQQAFGKSVYQSSAESNDSSLSNVEGSGSSNCSTPKKSPVKNTTNTVSLQPIQGSVIYTRQMPVGQTINLIPPGRGQVFRIAASNSEQISLVKDPVIQSKMSALLAAALQGKQKSSVSAAEIHCNTDTIASSSEDSSGSVAKVAVTTRPAILHNRVVKPVLQIPSNVIRTSPQLSSTTLEQLREFDMVYKQVKERSSTAVTPTGGETTSTTVVTLPNTCVATAATASAETSDSTPPPRISVAYLGQGQGQKYAQLSPVVVVSSYCGAGIEAVTTSSVTSQQDRSSPSATAVAVSKTQVGTTPTVTVTTTITAKGNSKGKSATTTKSSSSTTVHHTVAKSSPIPKPQQKPQEDEHTTQRIFDILAEYAEQLRNSPDLNNKPAPRRRSNPPTNPSHNSKRKKSSGVSKKPDQQSGGSGGGSSSGCILEADTEDHRTVGSEDSSCGLVQISMIQDEDQQQQQLTSDLHTDHISSVSTTSSTTRQPQQQLILTEASTSSATTTTTRNLIIAADSSSVGEALKMPNTAVLVPGNYIMPVSMVKGGQQIAVVSGGSKILATVPARSGGPNMLLFQSFLNSSAATASSSATCQTNRKSGGQVKYATTATVSGISSSSLPNVNAQPPVILPAGSCTAVALGHPVSLGKKTGDSNSGHDHSTSSDVTVSAEQPLLLTISPQGNLARNCGPQGVDASNVGEKSAAAAVFQPKTVAVIDPSSIATSVIAQTTTSCIKDALHHIKSSSESAVEADAHTQAAAATLITLTLDENKNKDDGMNAVERVQSVLVTPSQVNNGPMLSTPARYRKPDSIVNHNNSHKDEYLPNGEKSCQSNSPDPTGKQFQVSAYLHSHIKSGKVSRDPRQGALQLSMQRKQAVLERELRLQKSLSEECEDLGVDEPSASDLFPEADLLFDSNHSPSFDHQTSELSSSVTSIGRKPQTIHQQSHHHHGNPQQHHQNQHHQQTTSSAGTIGRQESTNKVIGLFSDDDDDDDVCENSRQLRNSDFLFETVVHNEPAEGEEDEELNYHSGRQHLTNGQRGSNGGGGESSGEDNTLLQNCASMSDVTLHSPISCEYESGSIIKHKYKFKYSNRKKAAAAVAASVTTVASGSGTSVLVVPSTNAAEQPWVSSVGCETSSCSEDDSTCEMSGRETATERPGSDGICGDGDEVDDEEEDDEDEMLDHCGDSELGEETECASGRGARRSVKKRCSCCNGQDDNSAKKRSATSPLAAFSSHKKPFLAKRR